jgi:hypothetical protein
VDAHAFSQQAQEIQTNTVFWDQKGILLTEFMALGTTITSEVNREMLNKLQRSIQNKRRGMHTKGVVILHDNSWPHTLARTNALIRLFNWEIFDHPPYSPDLAPSDYHLFIRMKVWLTWWRHSLKRDCKN